MNEQRQNRDLTAEACEWAAAMAMNELDEQERHRFDTWREKSPEHAAAYREACVAFDHPTIAAAMAEVANDISSIDGSAQDRSSMPAAGSWISRVRGLRTGAVAGALAATVLVVMWSISLLQSTPPSYPNQIVTAEHATGGGEIREITLPDGSFATLGAQSVVSVDFSVNERRVTLLEGEGYFEVVSDPSRPFIVTAGDAIVRAVGTAFDVRLAVDSVRVDVVEGTVRVRSPAPAGFALDAYDPPPVAITANAGERLIFEPESGLMKRPIAPGVELAAWRSGQLEYFNEELGRIVADANRYYDGKIKIVSDEIKTMKVTALFPISSIENIFELLAQQVPISVSKSDHGDILLSASNN